MYKKSPDGNFIQLLYGGNAILYEKGSRFVSAHEWKYGIGREDYWLIYNNAETIGSAFYY